jgi:hypothetical protein
MSIARKVITGVMLVPVESNFFVGFGVFRADARFDLFGAALRRVRVFLVFVAAGVSSASIRMISD